MEKVDNIYEQMWKRDGTYEKHSTGNTGNKAML